MDSTRVTARSTTSGSIPTGSRATCSIADCVRLPTILWVLEMTRSAPADRACSGSRSWNARCAPQASSTTSGTPCAWAASAKPRTSATAPKYVGETAVAPTTPGVSRSAASSASGVRQWAMPSSGSTSGATNVGLSPDRMTPSIVLECALRCTTIASPRCAKVSAAAWLPCDAPLIRNQVRPAPHASAASSCARWKGVGSGPTSMPWVSAGISRASARSPMASTSAGSAPGPPLWPGTWNRPGSRSA